MDDKKNRFGVANIPPLSNHEQTATYKTTGWAIDDDSRISMYAKRPASDESVELSSSSITIFIKDIRAY